MINVCEPFLDGKEIEYIQDAISTGWISSSGKYISLFENSFANYCGVKHGIAISNGTNALHLALIALGIKKGDEVIIPNFNGIYGAYALCYIGAKPIFVDSEIETWNIDPEKIEEKITEKTKAIMVVHIYGHPCKMNRIWEIAKKFNLLILEDAAEVHGAEYYQMIDHEKIIRKTGSLGNISIFSFFANKIITTGEGGMILTDDDELSQKCKYYKNLCFPLIGPRTFIHNDIGYNYRMSNLHAAIGLAQVEKLDYYVSLRRKNNLLYRDKLKDIPGLYFQPEQIWAKNVFWMNCILVNKSEFGFSRDELLKRLYNLNIDYRLFFQPMHRQPSLLKYGCDCSEAYPISDLLAESGFYLPSSSNIKEETIEYICNIIRSFYYSN